MGSPNYWGCGKGSRDCCYLENEWRQLDVTAFDAQNPVSDDGLLGLEGAGAFELGEGTFAQLGRGVDLSQR